MPDFGEVILHEQIIAVGIAQFELFFINRKKKILLQAYSALQVPEITNHRIRKANPIVIFSETKLKCSMV